MALTSNKPGRRHRVQVDLTYVDDVVLTTSKEAWTWVRLPDQPAGVMLSDRIRDYIRSNSAVLAKLCGGKQEIQGHLRITHIPTDPQDWAQAQLDESPNAKGPALARLVQHQVNYMEDIGHVDRRVHLGICLGATNTETFFNTGPFALFGKGRKKVEEAAGLSGDIISPSNLAELHARAHTVRTTLRSIGATPVSRQELTDLILNTTNPGMRPPRVTLPSRTWGPGVQEILFNDPVFPRNRMIDYLDIDDSVFTHAAYVAVAGTDDEYDAGVDMPWLYGGVGGVAFPVDWSIRFKVRSPQATAADLRKKTAHATDMHSHIREAGKTPPQALTDSVEQLAAFENEVGKHKVPGLYVQAVARVHDPDPAVLAGKVTALRHSFDDQDVELQWSTGDQMSYLLSEIPGGPDRHRPYEQHTNLSWLFGGGPTLTNQVGDARGTGSAQGRIGLVIAQTQTSVPTMVPFDPLNAVLRNAGGGFMASGSSGSGKTYLMQVIAAHLALRGVSLYYIDPKGDVVDGAGRRFRLPDLIEVLTGERPNIIDVNDSPDGILEPFRISEDRSECLQLALEVLEGLLGGSRSDSTEAALASAVNDEYDSLDPTLTGVLNRLRDSGEHDPAAKALYERLRMYRQMQHSRLLFGIPGQKTLQLGGDGQVTFIVTRGLELPGQGVVRAEMDAAQRLSSTVLTLLTRRATRALLNGNDDYPKALMVDESHVPMATVAGRKMIQSCIKMLRSRNGVVGLGSQELGDNIFQETGDEAVLNNITTFFGFRCESPTEAGQVLKVLDHNQDSTNEALRDRIVNLATGECYMRDKDKRVALIKTDFYLKSLQLAFETNADKRSKITTAQVQDALQREFGVTWNPSAARPAQASLEVVVPIEPTPADQAEHDDVGTDRARQVSEPRPEDSDPVDRTRAARPARSARTTRLRPRTYGRTRA